MQTPRSLRLLPLEGALWLVACSLWPGPAAAQAAGGTVDAASAAAASAPTTGLEPWSGSKQITLHAKDGSTQVIGRVSFRPRSATESDFELHLDHGPFKDHFLSMREFKCLEGSGEILCHVPYPYQRPSVVSTQQLAWLEHALLFLYKKPADFGAKLWNGVYWKLERSPRGLVGRPQAVDLNAIGAPPARLDIPPYRAALRDDMPAGSRWFHRLTIE